MGEVADMMYEGTVCYICGIFLDYLEDGDVEPVGYPVPCSDCRKDLDPKVDPVPEWPKG